MKIRILLVSAVLLCIFVLIALLWIKEDMHKQLHAPLALSADSLLHVAPGQSLTALAEELTARAWLPQPYYFIYEGRRQDRAASIKTGEYHIAVGTTPLQLLDILVAGKVLQYSMTIPEGWNFREIMAAVKSQPHLQQTLHSDKPEIIMQELGYSGYYAEGRIFPDTYHFPAGTTDVAFLQRAIRMQERVLAEEWQQREAGLPYQSPYEALIMASIIEKETGVAEERQMIAGVFVRRLQANMKLQTDPTVIYAMGEHYDGNIRRKDLSIDSPYNTYKYRGLPPTPIASPGRDAIHAALHPQAGTALYFVAKGDGSHYFSDSLREHNKAVARFQLKKF